MLIHPTVDRLRALGLAATAEQSRGGQMPHADWLGLLVDREVTARDNRRLTRRSTSAKLRQALACFAATLQQGCTSCATIAVRTVNPLGG